MAKFKLYLLTTNNNVNEDNNQITYIKTLISSFTDQESLYDNNKTADSTGDLRENFCYTQNEKISKHRNAQQDLSFDMARYIIDQSNINGNVKDIKPSLLNPFINKILSGTNLILEDKYGNERFFTVTAVDYKLGSINIIYSYKCQDSFTYQLSRQNSGYTIKNDYTSEDFIGTMDVDHWVVNYIQPDCKIMYDYISMNKQLVLDSANHIIVSDEINYTLNSELALNNTTVVKVLKPIYNEQ